ncbi:MAG TPA: N-acetylneuraminate synthase family protein, partial [Burkholderiales bacterium]|nr:N-acetylneuraminate synthase family protein [Burkholderiales bacterium]
VFKTERLVSGVAPDWVKRLRPKELPFSAFEELKAYADKAGIMFLATAHEEYSADFLNELGMPAFKIGSGEVSNTPYLRHLAKMGKPLIISTGLHDDAAIQQILDLTLECGNKNVALLHCVTAYPTPYNESNLRIIPAMQQRYSVPVGYSDHTIGVEVPLASVALGAVILEKHICLDKKIAGSQDCKVACDRADLKILVAQVRNIEAALGSDRKVVAESAKRSIDWARKSLVAKHKLQAGQRLSIDDIVTKRPGTGIRPDELDRAVGKSLRRAMEPDEVITWDDLNG